MLIAARKQPALERLYAGYGRRLLRGAFTRVSVGGAPWPEGDGPAIAYANHGAWWDPVLAVFLSHDVFRRDGYGLMDGAQLQRYPFFRRVGCFGVTSATEGDGLAIDDARAIGEYATALLQGGARRALWLFPQGSLLPSRVPLRFRSGLARISRAVPQAVLVPVAIRYEFRDAPRPECVVRVGEPAAEAAAARPSATPSSATPSSATPSSATPSSATPSSATPSSAALTRRLERELAATLAALDADLASGDDLAALGYRSVLTGGPTVSRVYDRTLGRLMRRGA